MLGCIPDGALLLEIPGSSLSPESFFDESTAEEDNSLEQTLRDNAGRTRLRVHIVRDILSRKGHRIVEGITAHPLSIGKYRTCTNH